MDAACGFNNPYLHHTENLNTIGLDIDPQVKIKNKIHKKFIISDIHEINFKDEFDYVISVYTWEHLQNPEIVLSKIYEALKDQGVFIIIAPNRYYYISIIERLLSSRFKNMAWKLLKGRPFMPYPAYYKLCTRRELCRHAEKKGFKLEIYKAIEAPPIWFLRVPPLFMVLCLWMSLLNQFEYFDNIKSTFIAVFKKV